jgi:hypothetical protein
MGKILKRKQLGYIQLRRKHVPGAKALILRVPNVRAKARTYLRSPDLSQKPGSISEARIYLRSKDLSQKQGSTSEARIYLRSKDLPQKQGQNDYTTAETIQISALCFEIRPASIVAGWRG